MIILDLIKDLVLDKPSILFVKKQRTLIQQAYMKITKNRILRDPCERNGYTVEEDITEKDGFAYVPFCVLSRVEDYQNFPSQPWLNTIYPAAHEPLLFFPLIDREIKKVEIYTHQETGLDFSKITDLKIELDNGQSPQYSYMNYQNTIDFAHAHGLTKFLLTSNVIQFGVAGHSIALFFEEGKVYYYDNLKENTSSRIEGYGSIGPIYEEAHSFKEQDLSQMSEEEFLQRVFQEIHFRCDQVAKIENKDYSSYSQTTIHFFKQPLIASY